jgi:hypothetical protein
VSRRPRARRYAWVSPYELGVKRRTRDLIASVRVPFLLGETQSELTWTTTFRSRVYPWDS